MATRQASLDSGEWAKPAVNHVSTGVEQERLRRVQLWLDARRSRPAVEDEAARLRAVREQAEQPASLRLPQHVVRALPARMKADRRARRMRLDTEEP